MPETAVVERPETLVITPETPATTGDERGETGSAPPKRGICRRCDRRDVAVNMLMLCYPCWVKTRLEERAKARGEEWHEGDPHPDDCGCVGLGEHKSCGGGFTGGN